MKKSFIVIGLGRFGLGIVRTLSSLTNDIIAIDVDEEAVTKSATYIDHCAICDSTKKSALVSLGVTNVDHAVVAIGNNLQATILTVINLKELGVKQITVRVDEEDHRFVMERLGATDVIIPEDASAISLANQIVSDTVLDYYEVNKEYGIVQIHINDKFEPKTLVEVDSRNKFDINIVSIIHDNEFILPKGTDKIYPGDIVIVIGKTNRVMKFDHYLNN